MKILTTLMMLISIHTNASMATYALDKGNITGSGYHGFKTGLFHLNSNINIDSPWVVNNSGYSVDKLRKIDAERGLKNGTYRKCEPYTEYSDLLLLSHKYTRYRCMKKGEYTPTEKYQAQLAKLRKSKINLKFNGFTPSFSQIHGEVDFVNSLNNNKSTSLLVLTTISSCLDNYGQVWKSTKSDEKAEKSLIQTYIDELLSRGSEKYVRCELSINNINIKSSTNTDVAINNSYYGFNHGYGSMTIDDTIQNIRVNEATYSLLAAAPVSNEYDKGSLQLAVQNYVDFMKFDYGLVLAEAAMGELSEAQAKLKIQKFLVTNKGRITELLSDIHTNMKGAPFFDKISAGFNISSVYGYVAKIEKSLKTVMTLDHIVKSYR